MTFADWFKENKKYIYGADVDAWCETAWDAGHAAGLQERATVGMEPVASRIWCPDEQNEYQYNEEGDGDPLFTATQLQQAVAAERENWRETLEATQEHRAALHGAVIEQKSVLRQVRDAISDFDDWPGMKAAIAAIDEVLEGEA